MTALGPDFKMHVNMLVQLKSYKMLQSSIIY